MIVVRLMAGLSNQMFQYAAARRLALHHKTSLCLDLSAYTNMQDIDTPRQYELDNFSIQGNTVDISEYYVIDLALGRKAKLKRFLRHVHHRKLWRYFLPEQGFDSQVMGLPNNTLLEGWFQSEKYFLDIKPTLLEDFRYKHRLGKQSEKIAKDIKNCESVSVHVRRGDYVTNKHANVFHGVLGADYYKKSMEYLENEVKNPHYFVFSDDVAWCKNNLKANHPLTFVDCGNSGAEDMELMRMCKHNILANSSFSWWGAWLGEQSSSIVVAPQQWFSDKKSQSNTDIVPERWVRL